jgi:hypothetical protein
LKAIQSISESDFKSKATSLNKGHGRIEVRSLQATTILNDYVKFPHCAQVFQINRSTTNLKGEPLREELVYGITSLTPEKANEKRLLEIIRAHWLIENGLHWVRDVTFDEDRSQIRTKNGPRVMASLRNLIISIFGMMKVKNIAAMLRQFSWNPKMACEALGF